MFRDVWPEPLDQDLLPPVAALFEALDGVVYLTDIEGRIVAANVQRWEQFATANGPNLPVSQVLGSLLPTYIQGEEVRGLYRRIHERLLLGLSYVSFTYRCDAPDIRRTMRMSVTPVRHRSEVVGVLYQSITLSAVQRPWVSLFDREALGGEDPHLPILVLCSICQHVQWPRTSAEWIEPEDYYRTGGPKDVQVSHGLCPRCKAQLLDEV